MCRRVACKTCEKPHWAGCGAHVESVLGDVPVKERCSCEASSTTSQSVFAKLFGAR